MRNVANTLDPTNPLCDSRLSRSWYKLELGGLPAELPTECPPVNTCGTQFQIWMKPSLRPEFGEDKSGTVCVAWKTSGKNRICCLWEIPVNVTHCGEFLVYHLKETDECHVSYCATGNYVNLCCHVTYFCSLFSRIASDLIKESESSKYLCYLTDDIIPNKVSFNCHDIIIIMIC